MLLQRQMMQTLNNVTLLAKTPNASAVVTAAARVCYTNKAPHVLIGEELDIDAERKFLTDLYVSGHLSPYEHVSFTFGITGISRSCSHQLVRHRIASVSQQSLRYTTADSNAVRRAATIADAGDKACTLWENSIRLSQAAYRELVDLGVPKEDARDILPMGTTSNLVLTMNARELLHFFELRLCKRAQREIRKIAVRMLWLLNLQDSSLFMFAGPYCMMHGGACNQQKSCGRHYTEQQELIDEYQLGV